MTYPTRIRTYPTRSVLKTLKQRRALARDLIRQYLINESLIDSDDKEIDYFVKVHDSKIRRLQIDLTDLNHVIDSLNKFKKEYSNV